MSFQSPDSQYIDEGYERRALLYSVRSQRRQYYTALGKIEQVCQFVQLGQGRESGAHFSGRPAIERGKVRTKNFYVRPTCCRRRLRIAGIKVATCPSRAIEERASESYFITFAFARGQSSFLEALTCEALASVSVLARGGRANWRFALIPDEYF